MFEYRPGDDKVNSALPKGKVRVMSAVLLSSTSGLCFISSSEMSTATIFVPDLGSLYLAKGQDLPPPTPTTTWLGRAFIYRTTVVSYKPNTLTFA